MAEPNRKQALNRPRILGECPLTSGGENAEQLLDYVNRTLDPRLMEIFESHVAICPACQAFADSQAAVWRALDEFEAMPVSRDFDRKLMERIQREAADPFWKRAWNWLSVSPFLKPAIPVAAMAVIAIGLWMKPVPEVAAPVDPVTKAEVRVDAEQVETALEDMDMLRDLGSGDVSGA